MSIRQSTDVILEQLEQTPYTRVLVFHGSVDHVAGILHARRVMKAQLTAN